LETGEEETFLAVEIYYCKHLDALHCVNCYIHYSTHSSTCQVKNAAVRKFFMQQVR